MTYSFYRYHYKGSLDRLKRYDTLAEVRAACIKKLTLDMSGDSRISGTYVIGKWDNDRYFPHLGTIGWMEGERAADHKRQAFFYYTGKGGFMGKAGQIRIAENGQTYKSNINRSLASPYNRAIAKKKKKEYK